MINAELEAIKAMSRREVEKAIKAIEEYGEQTIKDYGEKNKLTMSSSLKYYEELGSGARVKSKKDATYKTNDIYKKELEKLEQAKKSGTISKSAYTEQKKVLDEEFTKCNELINSFVEKSNGAFSSLKNKQQSDLQSLKNDIQKNINVLKNTASTASQKLEALHKSHVTWEVMQEKQIVDTIKNITPTKAFVTSASKRRSSMAARAQKVSSEEKIFEAINDAMYTYDTETSGLLDQFEDEAKTTRTKPITFALYGKGKSGASKTKSYFLDYGEKETTLQHLLAAVNKLGDNNELIDSAKQLREILHFRAEGIVKREEITEQIWKKIESQLIDPQQLMKEFSDLGINKSTAHKKLAGYNIRSFDAPMMKRWIDDWEETTGKKADEDLTTILGLTEDSTKGALDVFEYINTKLVASKNIGNIKAGESLLSGRGIRGTQTLQNFVKIITGKVSSGMHEAADDAKSTYQVIEYLYNHRLLDALRDGLEGILEEESFKNRNLVSSQGAYSATVAPRIEDLMTRIATGIGNPSYKEDLGFNGVFGKSAESRIQIDELLKEFNEAQKLSLTGGELRGRFMERAGRDVSGVTGEGLDSLSTTAGKLRELIDVANHYGMQAIFRKVGKDTIQIALVDSEKYNPDKGVNWEDETDQINFSILVGEGGRIGGKVNRVVPSIEIHKNEQGKKQYQHFLETAETAQLIPVLKYLEGRKFGADDRSFADINKMLRGLTRSAVNQSIPLTAIGYYGNDIKDENFDIENENFTGKLSGKEAIKSMEIIWRNYISGLLYSESVQKTIAKHWQNNNESWKIRTFDPKNPPQEVVTSIMDAISMWMSGATEEQIGKLTDASLVKTILTSSAFSEVAKFAKKVSLSAGFDETGLTEGRHALGVTGTVSSNQYYAFGRMNDASGRGPSQFYNFKKFAEDAVAVRQSMMNNNHRGNVLVTPQGLAANFDYDSIENALFNIAHITEEESLQLQKAYYEDRLRKAQSNLKGDDFNKEIAKIMSESAVTLTDTIIIGDKIKRANTTLTRETSNPFSLEALKKSKIGKYVEDFGLKNLKLEDFETGDLIPLTLRPDISRSVEIMKGFSVGAKDVNLALRKSADGFQLIVDKYTEVNERSKFVTGGGSRVSAHYDPNFLAFARLHGVTDKDGNVIKNLSQAEGIMLDQGNSDIRKILPYIVGNINKIIESSLHGGKEVVDIFNELTKDFPLLRRILSYNSKENKISTLIDYDRELGYITKDENGKWVKAFENTDDSVQFLKELPTYLDKLSQKKGWESVGKFADKYRNILTEELVRHDVADYETPVGRFGSGSPKKDLKLRRAVDRNLDSALTAMRLGLGNDSDIFQNISKLIENERSDFVTSKTAQQIAAETMRDELRAEFKGLSGQYETNLRTNEANIEIVTRGSLNGSRPKENQLVLEDLNLSTEENVISREEYKNFGLTQARLLLKELQKQDPSKYGNARIVLKYGNDTVPLADRDGQSTIDKTFIGKNGKPIAGVQFSDIERLNAKLLRGYQEYVKIADDKGLSEAERQLLIKGKQDALEEAKRQVKNTISYDIDDKHSALYYDAFHSALGGASYFKHGGGISVWKDFYKDSELLSEEEAASLSNTVYMSPEQLKGMLAAANEATLEQLRSNVEALSTEYRAKTQNMRDGSNGSAKNAEDLKREIASASAEELRLLESQYVKLIVEDIKGGNNKYSTHIFRWPATQGEEGHLARIGLQEGLGSSIKLPPGLAQMIRGDFDGDEIMAVLRGIQSYDEELLKADEALMKYYDKVAFAFNKIAEFKRVAPGDDDNEKKINELAKIWQNPDANIAASYEAKRAFANIGAFSNMATNFRQALDAVGYGKVGEDATWGELENAFKADIAKAFFETIEQDAISSKKIQARLQKQYMENGGGEEAAQERALMETEQLISLMSKGRIEDALKFAEQLAILDSKNGFNGKQLENVFAKWSAFGKKEGQDILGHVSHAVGADQFSNAESFAEGNLGLSRGILRQILIGPEGIQSYFRQKNPNIDFSDIFKYNSKVDKEYFINGERRLDATGAYNKTSIEVKNAINQENAAFGDTSGIDDHTRGLKYAILAEKEKAAATKGVISGVKSEANALEEAGLAAEDSANKMEDFADESAKSANDVKEIWKGTFEDWKNLKNPTFGGVASLKIKDYDDENHIYKDEEGNEIISITQLKSKLMGDTQDYYKAFRESVSHYYDKYGEVPTAESLGYHSEAEFKKDAEGALSATRGSYLHNIIDFIHKKAAEIGDTSDNLLKDNNWKRYWDDSYNAYKNGGDSEYSKIFQDSEKYIQEVQRSGLNAQEYLNPEFYMNAYQKMLEQMGVSMVQASEKMFGMILKGNLGNFKIAGRLDQYMLSIINGELGNIVADNKFSKADPVSYAFQTSLEDLLVKANANSLAQDIFKNGNSKLIETYKQHGIENAEQLANFFRDANDTATRAAIIKITKEGAKSEYVANIGKNDLYGLVGWHYLTQRVLDDEAKKKYMNTSSAPAAYIPPTPTASAADINNYIKQYKAMLRAQEDVQRAQMGIANARTDIERKNAQDLLGSTKQKLALIESQMPQIVESEDEEGNKILLLNDQLVKEDQILKIEQQRAILDADHLVRMNKINTSLKEEQGFLSKLVGGFKQRLNFLIDTSLAYQTIGKVRQVISKVVQSAIQLDAALVNVQIATGDTRKETTELMKSYVGIANEMGRTTTEVTKASNDWLRAGYRGQEVAELTRASMMLSTLGMIESAQATSYLISTLKGWRLEASEVIGVVDKLSAVDMNAAISAGDLASAMSRANNSARLAGADMDTFIGYVTTVADVTQKSAESVGESFKTIFSRFGNVKANKFAASYEEQQSADYSEEDWTNLNDIETVLSKVNIKVRDNAREWRDIDDILSDIGEKWETWDKTTQNAVATAIAGTRQRENVVTLFANWKDVSKYAEIAENAYGTATVKMLAYSDSIEAAKNRMSAAFEQLALDFNVSGIMRVLYENIGGLIRNLKFLTVVIGGYAIYSNFDKVSLTVLTGLERIGKKMINMSNPLMTNKTGEKESILSKLNANQKYRIMSNNDVILAERFGKKINEAKRQYGVGSEQEKLYKSQMTVMQNLQSTLIEENDTKKAGIILDILNDKVTEDILKTKFEELDINEQRNAIDSLRVFIGEEEYNAVVDAAEKYRSMALALNDGSAGEEEVEIARQDYRDALRKAALNARGNIDPSIRQVAPDVFGSSNFLTKEDTRDQLIKSSGAMVGSLLGGAAGREFGKAIGDFIGSNSETFNIIGGMIGMTVGRNAGKAIADAINVAITGGGIRAGLKVLMSSWVSIAALAAIGVIAAVHSEEEKRLKKLQEEISGQSERIQDAKEVDSLLSKIEKLSKGVNDLGKNVTLTEEEYQDFLDANNKLIEIFPELNVYVDEHGNKIARVGEEYKTLNEEVNDLKDNLVKTEALLITSENDRVVKEAIKESNKDYKDAQEEIERLQSQKWIGQNKFREREREYNEAIEEKEGSESLEFNNPITGHRSLSNSRTDKLDKIIEDFQGYEYEYRAEQGRLDSLISVEENNQKKALDKLEEYQMAYVLINDDYYGYDENVQKIIKQGVTSDYAVTAEDLASGNALEKMKDNAIDLMYTIDQLSQNGQLNSIMKMSLEDTSGTTLKTVKTRSEALLNLLTDMWGQPEEWDDGKKLFAIGLGFEFSEGGGVTNPDSILIDEIIKELGSNIGNAGWTYDNISKLSPKAGKLIFEGLRSGRFDRGTTFNRALTTIYSGEEYRTDLEDKVNYMNYLTSLAGGDGSFLDTVKDGELTGELRKFFESIENLGGEVTEANINNFSEQFAKLPQNIKNTMVQCAENIRTSGADINDAMKEVGSSLYISLMEGQVDVAKQMVQDFFGDLDVGNDGYINTWKEASDAIGQVEDSIKKLKDARAEENKFSHLSAKTVTDLLASNHAYIKILDLSGDKIKLKNNAEEMMLEIQKQTLIENARATVMELKRKKSEAEAQLKGVDISAKAASQTVDNNNTVIDNLNTLSLAWAQATEYAKAYWLAAQGDTDVEAKSLSASDIANISPTENAIEINGSGLTQEEIDDINKQIQEYEEEILAYEKYIQLLQDEDLSSLLGDTSEGSGDDDKEKRLNAIKAAVSALNKEYEQMISYEKESGKTLSGTWANMHEQYYERKRKLLELQSEELLRLANTLRTVDGAIKGSTQAEKHENEQQYWEYITDYEETVVAINNLDDEEINDIITMIEAQSILNNNLIKQYELLLDASDTLEERIENQEKLNKKIKEQRDLEITLLQFEREILDYQRQYNKATPNSDLYQKIVKQEIGNLHMEMRMQEEEAKRAYQLMYDKIYANYIDNGYSDAVAKQKAEYEAKQDKDYQSALKAYIAAYQKAGEVIVEEFNDKVKELEKEISKLQDEKPKEWAGSWSRGSLITSAFDKIDEYYSSIDDLYNKMLEEANEMLEDVSDLTDDQIETIVDKANSAIKTIRDNTIQRLEDIKSYQDSTYTALVNEVNRYIKQLQKQKEIVEDTYDKELDKLKDKEDAIDRTNKLLELQNNLQNAQNEKQRVYREGKINALKQLYRLKARDGSDRGKILKTIQKNKKGGKIDEYFYSFRKRNLSRVY